MTPTPKAGGMSRRDRAALAYAYEWLRSEGEQGIASAVYEASSALAYVWAGTAMRDAEDAMCDDHPRADRETSKAFRKRYTMIRRLLRARLALWLRAVLRADAGDFGPESSRCTLCETDWQECGAVAANLRALLRGEQGPAVAALARKHVAARATSRCIRPLWSLARPSCA